MVVSVVVGVALAVLSSAGLFALGSLRWTVRAGRAALPDISIVRPALAHFIMTHCHPGTAAYDATILDLAARGFIGARSDTSGIWLTYTDPGTATAGVRLAGYEQKVLDALHGRLENTGGAPFAMVAHLVRIDVEGTWEPFEKELRLAARARGICRRRLPPSIAPVLVAVLTWAAAVTLGAFAPLVRQPHQTALAVLSAVTTAIVFLVILAIASYQDWLTPAGSGLAAIFKQERAKLAADPASWSVASAGSVGWAEVSANTLSRRAFAVASTIPGAGPDPVTPGQRLTGRVVSRQPSEKIRPAGAWSSFSGNWRLVPIRRSTGPGMGAGIFRMAGIPSQEKFNAQVIARWQKEADSEDTSSTISYVAVDDGTKSWTFSGATVERLGLEDLVRVTVNPRTGVLIDLAVLERQRPSTPTPAERAVLRPPRPPEPLLIDDEVTQVVGPLIRITLIPTIGGYGTFYHGQNGNLSLIVASGGVANFGVKAGQPSGTPLPGIGNGAWLVSEGKSVMMLAGEQVAKITISGPGVVSHPDLMRSLAEKLAPRIVAQAFRAAEEAEAPGMSVSISSVRRPVRWRCLRWS